MKRPRRHVAGTLCGLATIVLALQTTLAVPASAGISYVGMLNTAGKAELYQPWGLTTDNRGNVYVADTLHHRIVKFDSDRQPLVAFGLGSQETSGQPGHLYYPKAVVWANDHIYVTSSHDVQVFSTGGAFIRMWGKEGSAEGDFTGPNGIASDCAGNIYVTDGRAGNIQKFSPNGMFLKRFGFGQIDVPAGVTAATYTADGRCFDAGVIVSDEYYGRVVRFDLDGNYLADIGTPGHGHLQFDHPEQLVAEPGVETTDFSLWVAEAGATPFRVQHLISHDGGTSWSYAGEITEGAGPLGSPHGVAVDPQGRLYIANTGGSQVYEYRREAPALHFSYAGSGRNHIKNTEGLFFGMRYNQLSKSCNVLVKATVTVPPNQSHVFTIENDAVVSNDFVELKLDLSDRQMHWLRQAWNDDRRVPVVAKARGSCSGDVHVTGRDEFKI